MELLSFSKELLALVLKRLSLAVHDGFKFFKVAQFNLQFLHLRLNEKRYQALDLTLFNLSQVLSFHCCRCQS